MMLALSVLCTVLCAGEAAAQGPLLMPDYNRDGKIDKDDCDRVAAGSFSIGVLVALTVYFAGENSSPTDHPPILLGHPPVRH